jgi:small subunit ribosomal protein S9
MSTAEAPTTTKSGGVALGTGRRKTSVARVRVKSGSGKISINERELDDYFPAVKDRNQVLDPLTQTDRRDSVDVVIRVHGGGPSGQAGACKLGLARALRKYDSGLDELLRHSGLLTRDGRMKERKKYGLRGARRGTQFSKR